MKHAAQVSGCVSAVDNSCCILAERRKDREPRVNSSFQLARKCEAQAQTHTPWIYLAPNWSSLQVLGSSNTRLLPLKTSSQSSSLTLGAFPKGARKQEMGEGGHDISFSLGLVMMVVINTFVFSRARSSFGLLLDRSFSSLGKGRK